MKIELGARFRDKCDTGTVEVIKIETLITYVVKQSKTAALVNSSPYKITSSTFEDLFIPCPITYELTDKDIKTLEGLMTLSTDEADYKNKKELFLSSVIKV